RGQKKRISIRRRSHQRFRRYCAAGTGAILNDELLSKALGEPLTDQARVGVVDAARREAGNDPYGPQRVTLSPGEPGYCRERGNTRGQLKKRSTTKPHALFSALELPGWTRCPRLIDKARAAHARRKVMIQVHLGKFLVLVASALCVALNVYPESVSAQEAYPSKPIHFLVTTAAGGAGDLVARALADRMSEYRGQPVIIENQPVGNGAIAAGQVARAAPDGYTLMTVVDSTLTINPHLYRNLPYDPFRDFAPVSIVSTLPLVLVVN